MAASYPGSVRNFLARVDLVDTVIADNVNTLQEELKAVQTTLGSAATGTSPLASTYSGTFAITTTWTTLSDRIANIEAGLMPEPKSEVSCPDCGEKMRNLEMDSHADLHKLGREAHDIALEEKLNNSIQHADNLIQNYHEERAAKIESFQNLSIKITNLQDILETAAEQHYRKDRPNTGEDK
jgi:hypothetical protein